MINILIACEESQTICKAFRERGFNAYSCDILPCSGGHPEWHIKGDVLKVLDGSFQAFGQFWTEAGTVDHVDKWDLMIGHPECTRLTVTANKWYKPEYADRFPNIHREREAAVEFFMKVSNANIERIAIENPVGVMSTRYRKPDQIIQPWQFGDRAVKRTCLWLKGLPKLVHTDIVEPEYVTYNSKSNKSGKSKYPMLWSGGHTSKDRSKTFPGIAKAVSEQWGDYLLKQKELEKYL